MENLTLFWFAAQFPLLGWLASRVWVRFNDIYLSADELRSLLVQIGLTLASYAALSVSVPIVITVVAVRNGMSRTARLYRVVTVLSALAAATVTWAVYALDVYTTGHG